MVMLLYFSIWYGKSNKDDTSLVQVNENVPSDL